MISFGSFNTGLNSEDLGAIQGNIIMLGGTNSRLAHCLHALLEPLPWMFCVTKVRRPDSFDYNLINTYIPFIDCYTIRVPTCACTSDYRKPSNWMTRCLQLWLWNHRVVHQRYNCILVSTTFTLHHSILVICVIIDWGVPVFLEEWEFGFLSVKK